MATDANWGSQRLDEWVKSLLVNAWRNASAGNEMAFFFFCPTMNKLDGLNLASSSLIWFGLCNFLNT